MIMKRVLRVAGEGLMKCEEWVVSLLTRIALRR